MTMILQKSTCGKYIRVIIDGKPKTMTISEWSAGVAKVEEFTMPETILSVISEKNKEKEPKK